MARTRFGLISLVFALVPSTISQFSNVDQCVPDYQWALNSLGQTPCLVAAYLESVCDPGAQVDQIPLGTHYIGPDLTRNISTSCVCSTVTYSLISACGGCQGRTFLNWTTWSTNCTGNVYFTVYPEAIPAAVVVPSWAYLNISLTNNTFDETAARNSSVQTPSPTAIIPPTSSPSSSQSSSKSHAGAIAGGVVGGIAGISIIVLVVFWFFLRGGKRWKRRSGRKERVDLSEDPISPAPDESYTHERHLISPVSMGQAFTHSREVSDDIVSPVTSGIYTTFGRNSLDSVPYNSTIASPGRGYTGAAELS